MAGPLYLGRASPRVSLGDSQSDGFGWRGRRTRLRLQPLQLNPTMLDRGSVVIRGRHREAGRHGRLEPGLQQQDDRPQRQRLRHVAHAAEHGHPLRFSLRVHHSVRGWPSAQRASSATVAGLPMPAFMRVNALRFSVFATVLALLGLAGCGSGPGSCRAGSLCECAEGTDCYQGCADGDGCDLLCHNMVHCGGVCGGGCTLGCHDVNDCSASCGDSCAIDCHNTVSCGAFCGSNCRYDCHDVDRCGVRAGPASIITCTSVTTCAVECQGSCQVICNDAKSCDLTCLSGPPPTSCADGTVRCGSC